MSTARLGGDGRSISPMKSLSAFMYAPLRMLPASLIADCSSSPRSFDEPCGRRSISSERRIAVGFGKTRSVRPVRSPSMCISTAATGSSGPETCGGTSSSRAMLIVGTLIMIVQPVICESAVAACPAPMFATSRNASSWFGFKDRMSSIISSEQTADVADERRSAVAENCCTAEQREPAAYAIELLDHDLLLPDQLVDDQPRPSLADLDHDHLLGLLLRRREPHQLAHAEQGEHVVAQHQHFLPLHPAQQRRLQLDRLVHVRHRQRIELVADAREERADDGERQRQPHRDGRSLLRHRADLDEAA